MNATFCTRYLCAVTTPVFSSSVFAQNVILRVDGSDGSATPAGHGNGWDLNAYKYLADAIGRAEDLLDGEDPPDAVQIWVRGANGEPGGPLVYRPDRGSGITVGDPTKSFNLRANVALYGGFHDGDDELSDRNPDPETNGCVLSGDLNDDDGANFANRDDNSASVVKASSGLITSSTILDGFTIRSGRGTNGGGGIVIASGASPLIRNCRITDNTGKGAGAYSLASSPIFRDCVFIANRCGDNEGGGLFINGGDPTVVQCDFIRNFAKSSGGGIRVDGEASVLLFNNRFLGNQAEDHDGGALFARHDPMDSEDSASLLVVNCAFVGNTCKDTGGAVRVGFDSVCRFVQCTFVSNSCTGTNGHGGGLSAGAQHAGVVRAVTLDNCVFWNNAGTNGSQLSLNGTYPGTASIHHSDIQDSDSSEPGIWVQTGWTAPTLTAVIDVNPDFVADPAPGAGGWGSSDDDYGDLTPSSGSPIINKGSCALLPPDYADVDNNTSTTLVVPLDLGLMTRQVDRVDIGAMEYQTPGMTCAGDVNADGSINVADLLAVIIHWSETGAPPEDINNFPCGDGVVGVADLLAVITHWGVCNGTPSNDAPQTVQDCMDICGGQFGFGSPEYCNCMEKCCSTLP